MGYALSPASPPLLHSDMVRQVTFSPDGERLTSSIDQSTRLWRLAKNEAGIMFTHSGPVRHAEFSPDGERVLTASGQRTDLGYSTGLPLLPLAHSNGVHHASFSSDVVAWRRRVMIRLPVCGRGDW